MTEPRADLLQLIGMNPQTFYAAGEDVRVESADHNPYARIFRRGGKVVYRVGTGVEWDDDDGHPVTDARH
jgi:hypothetical protein